MKTTNIFNPVNFPIHLSDRALEMAENAVKADDSKNSFLRISIKGGGCSGLQYNLDIDNSRGNFDLECKFEQLCVITDIFSLRYLENTKIDYQESLEGAGFKFDNPGAKTTCGCGSSFS